MSDEQIIQDHEFVTWELGPYWCVLQEKSIPHCGEGPVDYQMVLTANLGEWGRFEEAFNGKTLGDAKHQAAHMVWRELKGWFEEALELL